MLLFVVVPLPSWPLPFEPQQPSPPDAESLQLWYAPAAIASTPLEAPVTATGTLLSVVVPSPSWPYSLKPQHWTPPSVVSAQVWYAPAAIASTSLEAPVTATGTLLSVVVPSPSWPFSLKPQHWTPPPVVSAQVWNPPAAMAATPLARPLTATGTLLIVPATPPSWPLLFKPQHWTPPPVVSAQVW